MNGRKDQIVLVEAWHASLVAGGIWRVEREFGQKSFAARVAGRDLPKLYEVALADGGRLQVVRQNLEVTSAHALGARGRPVRVGWREDQTYAIETDEEVA